MSRTRFATMLVLSAVMSSACAGTPPEAIATPLGGPQEPRFDHSAVWTGSEILIVGGAGGNMDDGLLVDESLAWTADGGFEPIPSPPGPPIARHAAVWTGEEMIIWSGSTVPFGVGQGLVTTAAAFDPTTRSWRRLASSPSLLGRVDAQAAVAGDNVVVAGGTTPDSTNDILVGVYSTTDDRWREISVPGRAVDVASRNGRVYILTIDEGGAGLSMLDPTTMELDSVTMPEGADVASGGAIVTLGSQLMMWLDGPEDSIGLFANDAPDDPWRLVDVDPGSADWQPQQTGLARRLAAVGSHLVTLDGDGQLRWIDPAAATEQRQILSSEQRCALGNSIVPIGDAIFAWNGSLCEIDGETFTGGYILRPPPTDA